MGAVFLSQLSEPEERSDPAPVRWDALPIALEISRRLRPHHKDARVLINILTAQKFLVRGFVTSVTGRLTPDVGFAGIPDVTASRLTIKGAMPRATLPKLPDWLMQYCKLLIATLGSC